jgi:hypothetical protein
MATAPTEHNHPPRCCCEPDHDDDGLPSIVNWILCPNCPEHGAKPDPIDCPQCHTPIGRPHTEYCTLGPDKVWDGVLPALDCHGEGHALEDEVRDCRTCTPGPRLVCRRCHGYGLLGVVAGVNPVPCPDCAIPACAYPGADHGDGRGCQHDDCPKHGGR